MLIVLFLVSHFNFLFVPCGGLSWLPVCFLLHVKYTVSYRIVSYRIRLGPLTGAPNAGGMKNRDFRPIDRFISEMIQDRVNGV